jgi:hypothetical protein
MSWLFNWNEAAKHPRRTVAAMFLSGLVGGGLVGYFRFNHSLGWAVALGLGFAVVLGRAGWTAIHDPERLAQLTSRGGGFRDAASKASIRLMIPAVSLAVATGVGLGTRSVNAFVVALAICVVLGSVAHRLSSRL